MRVLLTGATGFIGQRALGMLVEHGHRVRVLARHRNEAASLLAVGVSDVVVGDVTDSDSVDRATQGMEVLVHLAARLPGNPREEITHVNERGTETVLRACVKNRVRRFVFASSTSVYVDASNPQARGISETAPLRTSASSAVEVYGLSKVHAEQRVCEFHVRHRLAHVILRLPLVYGSRDGWDRKLVDRIRLQPWKTLSRPARLPSLQWVHVDDACLAILLAATGSRATEGAFNIAGGELFSLREIAVMVRQIDAAATLRDLRNDGLIPPRPLKYRTEKARQRLGFVASVPLYKALRRQLKEAA